MVLRLRFPRRRSRPPRSRAKLRLEGLTAAELGAKVGLSARTVRYYTAQRVLPSPQFRGAATRYLHEHLVHLAAIVALRNRRYSLDAIRRQLEPLDGAALAQLAATVLPELARSTPTVAPATAITPAVVHDAWYRVSVLPGFEVNLHTEASAEVRALAIALVAQARASR